jgi:hypothetical protein
VLREIQTLLATGTDGAIAAQRGEPVLADCVALSERSERMQRTLMDSTPKENENRLSTKTP